MLTQFYCIKKERQLVLSNEVMYSLSHLVSRLHKLWALVMVGTRRLPELA